MGNHAIPSKQNPDGRVKPALQQSKPDNPEMIRSSKAEQEKPGASMTSNRPAAPRSTGQAGGGGKK